MSLISQLPVRFGLEECIAASEGWRFNCGPGALCGVLGLTPAELRPHCRDFPGYTNPTYMLKMLESLRVQHRRVWRADNADRPPVWPQYGIARIQWGGSWTKPGARMSWRYRFTHWIGVRSRQVEGREAVDVFDINAITEGDGWCLLKFWEAVIVPDILENYPKANGEWWPTHCYELLNLPLL